MQVISRSLCVFFMCVPFVGDALAQSNLPTQVRADMLKTQVVDSVGKGDAQTALKAIAEYRSLGVEIPTPLLFLEAKLSSAQKDYIRAESALEAYFKQAKSGDDNYSEALRLFPNVKKPADAIRQQNQREAEERRKAQTAAALQAKREQLASRVGEVVQAVREDMTAIPAGSYKMGQARGKGATGDGFSEPVHTVVIKAFRISKHEVKKDWWQIYLAHSGTDPNLEQGGLSPNREPVIGVSWDQAQSFVDWLSAVSGQSYRLPSEAEWEYAARAGTNSAYPWGNRFDSLRAVGMQRSSDDGAIWGSGKDVLGVVFEPTKWGLNHVIGNASEWVADCWHNSYVGAPADGSAWISDNCESHVLRGGSAADVFVTGYPAVLNLISGKQDIHISVWTRVAGSGQPRQAGFRLASD